MAAADPSTEGGPGSEDPLVAARAWLLANGGWLPEPLPARPSAAPAARAAHGPAGSDVLAGGPPDNPQVEDETSPSVTGGRGDGPAGGDPEADPVTVARQIVVRKLAAQARTRHELAKALAAREVPGAVADQVLDRMEAVGLVDDAAFAQDWVASRQARRHLSQSALRRELRGKGVDRDLIDAAVAGVGDGEELDAALSLARKKLRSMAGLERQVQYRRLAGALARRGFGPLVASTVLATVLDEHAAEGLDR